MHDHFVTPDAVYGLILYSALIGGVSDDDSNSTEVLAISAVSLLIFWGGIGTAFFGFLMIVLNVAVH